MPDRTAVFILFFFCIQLLSSSLEFRYSYSDQSTPFLGVVNGTGVNIREKPNLTSRVVKKATLGEDLFVLRAVQGFYEIKLPPQTGFISSEFVRITEEQDLIIRIGVVTGNNVNLRKDPSLSSGVITRLAKGTELLVYSSTDEFYRVELRDEPSGYIFQEFVSAKKGTLYNVKGNRVNLRSGPGTSFSATGQLMDGEQVMVIKTEGGFSRVLLNNGKSGWISTDYLEKVIEKEETSDRSQILKDFSEENFPAVIRKGEEFVSSSPVPDVEVLSSMAQSFFNTRNYAGALLYLTMVKNQSPEFFLKNLAELENKILTVLGKHKIMDIDACCITSCDFRLDGIEDFILSKKNSNRFSADFYQWEERLKPSGFTVDLPDGISEFYQKTLDVNNDGKEELLVKKGETLVAFELESGKTNPRIIQEFPYTSDLCFEERHSLKTYGISGKNGNFQIFRQKKGKSDSEALTLRLPLESPLLFPAYLNRSVPQFLLADLPSEIYLLTWDRNLTAVPLKFPSLFSDRKISYITTIDADFDDSTDMLIIFSSSETTPSQLGIFSISSGELVCRYSIEISALAARGSDLDWNGKEDLLIVSPDKHVYALFDVLGRK